MNNSKLPYVLASAMLLSASTAAYSAPTDQPLETWRVAVTVYDGVEILDFAGPTEVFQKASRIAVDGQPAFEVFMLGPSLEPVTSMEVLTIVPEYSIAACPVPQILVLAGGRTESIVENDSFMTWIKQTVPETQHTMSVCTGFFMLAENDLLEGLDATTYWRLVDAIPVFAPGANPKRHVRFTDNGQILTTAGVSAGIDGALHIVARRLGYYPALMVARQMEYDWKPSLEDVQKYTPYRYDFDAMTWWRLGYSLRSLGHMDAAIDALQHAVDNGNSARQRRAYYDMAALQSHLGRDDDSIDALRKSLEAGRISSATLESDSDFKNLRDDPRFVMLLDSIRMSENDAAQ